MARRKTKSFDFAKGVYYFNINKGYNSAITIKREEKNKALLAYSNYLVTQKGNCEWLGKWDGKKFLDDDYEKLVAAKKTSAA